ncbi:MAG: FecR domain-containing protein, partial [Gammaproteobacteria bacterium]|nr:FecR domain-containing protein [Gammaproteobacteria bacterium]
MAVLAWSSHGSALAADPIQEPAGHVVLSRGAVSAVKANGTVRLLGKGSEVFNGDRITTAKKSFAVIEFIDAAKVTVRPNSELLIERYRYTNTSTDGSTLNLVKGGLRAITGRIGANNPKAYTVRTPLSVLGIRGTEYDARLCAQDCRIEEQQYQDVIPRITGCPMKLEEIPPGFYAT